MATVQQLAGPHCDVAPDLKTGADVVVETLEGHKVSHVFGVPGAKIDKVFDRLLDSSIKTVVCRHEQNAAFIAGGIGRMTGKAGVAIVTSGPGVSNTATGLATANSEGDPLVVLGGAVSVADRLKSVHQTMDSVELCRPITKYAAEIDSPSATAEVLSAAFRAAEGDRPGSAFVSLPADIATEEAKCKTIRPSTYQQGPAAKASISEAARLINFAKAPVILIGLMASKPRFSGTINKLLASTALPVVGTFQAAGAISRDDFRYFGGRVGQLANQPADALLESGDVVITIGYDAIEYWPSLWNKNNNDRPIIHIDVAPAKVENDYSPAIELIGDIEETLDVLSPLLDRPRLDSSSFELLQRIAKDREQLMAVAATKSGNPIHPLRLVSELQKLITPDVTICSDMGSFSMYLSRYLFSFRARQFLITNGQQTLGVALPWAIAASIVRPQEKVLSISGDGGFLFSAAELETAVRLNLHLVHMIWVDGHYDMVGTQQRIKYGRTSAVDFGALDYIKYAQAFGATGLQIRDADEIAPTLKKAFDIAGPVLIEVHVDYRDNAKLFEQVHEGTIV